MADWYLRTHKAFTGQSELSTEQRCAMLELVDVRDQWRQEEGGHFWLLGLKQLQLTP